MKGRSHFLLGVFVVVVVALLGYYTLFLRDFTLFGEKTEFVVQFPAAKGLREGDAVLVAGVRWGRVAEIVYDAEAPVEQRITVTCVLNDEVRLFEDAEVVVEEATMLGGRQIAIDPGTPGRPALDLTRPLAGRVRAGALDSVGEFLGESGPALSETIRDLRELVAGVKAGEGVAGRLFRDEEMATNLSSAVADAARTFDRIAAVAEDLASGKGTLGRLIAEEGLYQRLTSVGDQLAAVLDETGKLVSDARSGDGLVARLLSDREMAEDTARAVRAAREIVEEINSGRGTLGALVRDDGIARRVDALLARLDEGEGTLGKLFTDDALYDDLTRAADDLAAVAAKLRNGEGTLGKLLTDEGFYEEAQRAMALVTKSLEEYREAAPISTMTSVLFGAF